MPKRNSKITTDQRSTKSRLYQRVSFVVGTTTSRPRMYIYYKIEMADFRKPNTIASKIPHSVSNNRRGNQITALLRVISRKGLRNLAR